MTMTINVYKSGDGWYGARWVDGEYDGCDVLDAATESEAMAAAAAVARDAGAVADVRRVADVDG